MIKVSSKVKVHFIEPISDRPWCPNTVLAWSDDPSEVTCQLCRKKIPPDYRVQPGRMSVSAAGRKGGLTVRDERGVEFYEEIGRKGGQRVRDLIRAGKKALAENG